MLKRSSQLSLPRPTGGGGSYFLLMRWIRLKKRSVKRDLCHTASLWEELHPRGAGNSTRLVTGGEGGCGQGGGPLCVELLCSRAGKGEHSSRGRALARRTCGSIGRQDGITSE